MYEGVSVIRQALNINFFGPYRKNVDFPIAEISWRISSAPTICLGQENIYHGLAQYYNYFNGYSIA